MCDVKILMVILGYVLSHEDHKVIENGQEESIRMQLKENPMSLGGHKVGWFIFVSQSSFLQSGMHLHVINMVEKQ